ncbi:MAG: tRNA (adenosine(37)-N6)-dimethylallyltransferase MiaA [Ruminococcus sp.]|nr:tRNA (adenosine(37)-N6)-dimethylallyltransferase MiaA [Ruminococcus sp.]
MNGKIKPKVLAVVGATASGKTALSVELAKKYDGEIISADSMQIYKGLDIASAKPTVEEMQGIPHHLIDFLERDVVFSVSDYVRLANEKIKEVLNRGKLPIVTGGTGLYIDSLLENVRFSEGGSDEVYRAELYNIAREKGNEFLHDMLKSIDPVSAENIHMNNLVRVVRALEVYHITGRLFSELKAESRLTESPYDSLIIGLNFHDRQILYNRINHRVDEMVNNGMIQEAEELWLKGNQRTSSNAIGYKELIPYFEKTMSLNDCLDRIKQETRRYAKRQLTWFRKNTRIQWLFLDEFNKKSEILEKSEKTIENCWNV